MLNNSNPGTLPGPPHFVDLHVNPGESVSIQLFDGNEQILRGPATVTMISQHTFPPIPMPIQVPPGHMVQQIVDENGTLRHIILSALNNNGTTTPAATLLPQQQPFPFCCCCCYCSTTPTAINNIPPPPPPPPPPPQQVHHGSVLAFPAPQNLRRRIPSRSFSYSKRSSNPISLAPQTAFHANNPLNKSPNRHKSIPVSVQDSITKFVMPSTGNIASEQTSVSELTVTTTTTTTTANNTTFTIKTPIKEFKMESCIQDFLPSISPNSVDSSVGYSSDKYHEDGDTTSISNNSNDVLPNGTCRSITPSISPSIVGSEIDNSEEKTPDATIIKDGTNLLGKQSESSENLSTDTELSTLEISTTGSPVKNYSGEFECCYEDENESPLKRPSVDENSVSRIEVIESESLVAILPNESQSNEKNEPELKKSDLSESKTTLNDESLEEHILESGSSQKVTSQMTPNGLILCAKQEDQEISHMCEERFSDENNDLECRSKSERNHKKELDKGSSPQRSPKHLLPQVQQLSLTYTSLTATSVKLKWVQVNTSNATSNLFWRHYMVEMILSKSNGNKGSPSQSTRIVYQGNSNSCRISHLSSQQQYSFRVRTSSDDYIVVSNVLTITTPELPIKPHKRSKQHTTLQQQLQQQQQQILQQQILLNQQQQNQNQQHDQQGRQKLDEKTMDGGDQKCAIIILLLFTFFALIMAALVHHFLNDYETLNV